MCFGTAAFDMLPRVAMKADNFKSHLSVTITDKKRKM